MSQKFTKLMAAFALLVFMMPSMAGWGQTRDVTTLFEETFAASTGTMGWSGNACNGTLTADNSGWTFVKGYGTEAAAKFGTSSALGSAQTPAINFTGDATLTFKAGAWSGDQTTLKLSGTNCTLSVSTVTLVDSNWSNYTVQITNATGNVKIKFEGKQASKARFLLDDVVVTQETGGSSTTTYTVTLADDNTTLTQSAPGASVTLPTRSAIGSYTFAGWSSTEVANETTTAPTIIPAGAYTPTGDITLYPVYTRTEGGGVSPSAFSVGDTGDFAIVSEAQNGKYYALPTNPTLNSGKITAQEITVSELNGVKYITTTNANGFSWTIASATNGYSLSDGSNYIYHSNGGSSGTNLAYGTSTSYTWAFTLDGDFVKMAGMNGSTTNSRGLLFSGTTIGGYSLSNWGNSGYYKTMILPVCASGTTYYWSNPSTGPIISANAPATLAYNATGGEFGYSILNPATGVTLEAESNSDWITNVAVNANNSTVTFSTSTNTTYTQRTGTITLSYTGATDKVVTITQEAAPDPVITASNVEIAFDASSGSIAYSITNEPTPAGTMTAAVASGGTIANLAIGTIENNAVAFTCAANNTSTTRTATVTLTYTYGNSLTVTKNVTITQAADPNAVDNISDIAGENELRNVKGTIVAMSARGFILGDGTGYVYYYGGSDFATTHGMGDVVKLSGTTSSYNHVIQFPSGSTITSATNSGYNNTPAVQILDASGIGTYSNDLHLSDYVQFHGTLGITTNNTSTFYNIAVSGLSTDASISYPTAAQIAELEDLNDKMVVVKGYFAGVSSGHFNVILESIEELVVPVINASDVNIAYTATSGSIAYTISNEPTPAGTLTAAVQQGATIENLQIGTITSSAVPFTCDANTTGTDRTATVMLTYTYGNNETATKTVIVTQAAPVVDYATLPFAFDGNATAVADVAGLTQDGLSSYNTELKLQFNSTDDWLLLHFNERPGELSYYIKGNTFSKSTFKVQVSADGVTYTDFATYTNLTSDIEHITHNNLDENVRYIKWVYTAKGSGNVALGNITLDVYEAPQEYTLTIGGHQNATIIAHYGDNQILVNGSAGILSGSEVVLDVYADLGYVLDLVTVLDAEESLISLTQESENQWSFIMPSRAIVVSATTVPTHAPYYYTRATSLEPGRRYIIVAERNEDYLAMGAQKANNRDAKPITVDGTDATVIRADVHEFTISSVENEEGYYSIYDVDTESPGYLHAGSSDHNWLLTQTTLDDKGKWAISIDSETGVATIVASKSGFSRNVMRFNLASTLFSCYGENNDQYDVYLYVKDDGFALTIDGYENDNVKNGYYLIASPVTVNPANVAGMTTGNFDLYYYDQSQEKEWINWKGDEDSALDHGGFDLVPGMGYLYAKKATADNSTYTFTLSGEVYSGDGSITLIPGWNLVGNPYGQRKGLDIEGYYIMNENGSAIVPGEDGVIEAMQGFFAYGSADVVQVGFYSVDFKSRRTGLSLNLSQGATVGLGNDVIDRAIVRFGEGSQLPKFQLNPDNTKIYFTEGNQDYAVVRSAYEGELPVNFKASENGTYTLSMNAQELSLDYLHLIDNKTGMDVDLLQTPSYTFEASTTDYASRFKLVIKVGTGIEEGNVTESFAFFNGTEWVVNNEGNATLQVVDMTGRMVSNTEINGNTTVNINEAAGVYMLRLVNGDNVKVQKIVVR